MRVLILGALLVVLTAGAASSQQVPANPWELRLDGAPAASLQVQDARPEPGIHSPILAAAGLGLLGWGLGALAGATLQDDCFDEFCEWDGIFYGGAAGGGLGLAAGAHLGNLRRGSFALDLIVSGAVWGLGYAAMSSAVDSGDDTGVLLTAIMLPPTQLLATVLAERASSK